MEQNEKKPKDRIRALILVVALVLIAVSGFQLISGYMDRKREQDEYDRLAREVKQTTQAPTTPEVTQDQQESTEGAYVSPIDFDALKQRNPDIVGWITVPGTNIDYPIVQTSDNEKYLHTDFDGNESIAGTVYLDMDSQKDFSGRHNIIYGHNMKNGTMFKDVVKFKDQSFFEEHRDIYIYTPRETIHLRTIAALYGNPDGIKRKTQFSSQAQFEEYIDSMTVDCTFRELPEETPYRLYSLVTCSYEFNDARTILYAAEVPGEGLGPIEDEALSQSQEAGKSPDGKGTTPTQEGKGQ